MSVLRLHHRQVYLVFLSLVWTLTLHAEQSDTALVFYAQSSLSEDLWPALFQAVRTDLAEGAGELPNGIVLDSDPIFVRGSDNLRGITFPKVVSVKLLGRCDVLPQIDRPLSQGPLGWVRRIGGTIQPFVFIDCTRLAQVLRRAAPGLDKEGRRSLMAQAMANVLIHEWSHVATQSSSHDPHGINQAYLSVSDLIAVPKSNHSPTQNR